VASDDVVYGDIYGFVNKVVVISTERRQVKIMPRRQLTACLQRTRRSALPNEQYRPDAFETIYASADCHFGPFRRLGDTDDHCK